MMLFHFQCELLVSFRDGSGSEQSQLLRSDLAGIIEVALLLFFFYSIRLMWEFTAANGRGKSLAVAPNDILTQASFVVAIISALFGLVVVEYLRKKL